VYPNYPNCTLALYSPPVGLTPPDDRGCVGEISGFWPEPVVVADGAGITAYRGMKALLPAPLLNWSFGSYATRPWSGPAAEKNARLLGRATRRAGGYPVQRAAAAIPPQELPRGVMRR